MASNPYQLEVHQEIMMTGAKPNIERDARRDPAILQTKVVLDILFIAYEYSRLADDTLIPAILKAPAYAAFLHAFCSTALCNVMTLPSISK
jgi:hypothetical protein